MWQIIVVFGIGTRQGCKLFKVLFPHLILVAWICVCIIIGSPDRVIDALRQVDWLFIKFKSIVGWWSLAKVSFLVIQIWSSHFYLAIIVWESIVANSCIWHWHETGLQTFKVIPPHLILVARICVCIIIGGSLDRVIDALRQVDWLFIKFKSIVGWSSLAKISLPVIQIWSSHFCLVNIVWESIVANSCIWHWHETGLWTF